MFISESQIRKIIRDYLLSEITTGEKFRPNFSNNTSYSDTSSSQQSSDGDLGDGDFKNAVNFGPSTSVKSSVNQRAVELGEKLGIDPAWIYAEEAKESAHNPSAMAWNLHIMVDPKWAKKAGVPGKAVTPEQKAELKKLGFPSNLNKSYYGSEAKRAFSKAYKVNPWAAIAGGAWGLYQVLGAFTLPLYGNDPEKWKAAFEGNPTEYSKKSLGVWIDKYGQEFKDAVNRGDYAYTTKKYYGAPNKDYENFIRSHVAKFRRGQKKKKEDKSTS
mgnify:FL=1